LISKRDVQLGKIALRAGMVTKEQLAKSLAIQKKLEKPVGLGAIFIKKGYITKEQLEEIVSKHNDTKDTNGATTDDKPKKKKKKKKKAGTDSESEVAPASDVQATSSAEAKALVEEPPKKTSTKLLKKSGAGHEPAPSGESEIDVALLESAPSDAGPIDEDDPERRILPCGKCDKKYRIKKKQLGKKFACRQCKAKVKIPKDLFDKPAAKTSGKQAKSAVPVAEFSLGSSDDTGSDEKDADPDGKKATARQAPPAAPHAEKKPSGGIEKKKSGTATAAPPGGKPAAPAKPGDPTSIAELAKRAAEKRPTTLGPKTTPAQKLMGYVQAVIALGVVAGIVGGIWYWKHSETVEREQQAFAAQEGEWKAASEPYDAALGQCKKALAQAEAALKPNAEPPPGMNNVRDLTSAGGALEKALGALQPGDKSTLQNVDNVKKAHDLLESSKPEGMLESLYLARGKILLAVGGESNVLEANRGCAEIVQKDAKSADALALLGQAELRRRNYAPAIDALKKSLAVKNDAHAHALLALALEAGDLCRDAAKEYEALAAAEPIALVFKARALVADGAYDEAVAAADAAKLEGEAMGAALVQKGFALEKKGDVDGALKVLDGAVTAGGQSGRALIARGEVRLRAGRFAEAAQDFDAALKASGGARAGTGLAACKLATLETDEARRDILQATTLKVVVSTALLQGEFDAFDDPRAADPRATAFRKAGDMAFAADHVDEARGDYVQALILDPFDAESHAAATRVELKAKNLPAAEVHVKAARALLTSGREHDSKNPAPPVRGAGAARVLLVEALFWDARGELEKAEKAIDAALAADPTEAGSAAFALKGAVLERRGENDRARNEYQRALDLEVAGKDSPSRFYNDAQQLVDGAKGDQAAIDKARAELEVALSMAPRHAHALRLRGKLALLEKKYDVALQRLNAALEANKYYLEGYLALGFFFIKDLPDSEKREGMAENALTAFTQAVQLAPDKAECYYGRALALWAKNNVNDTLLDLDKAAKLDANNGGVVELQVEVYKRLKKDKEAAAAQKKLDELKKSGKVN
jgi:tetratricopeptide (TPR) repeat protein